MPRVIGMDLGTVTLDVCGLDDGHVFLERSLPTSSALADPAALLAMLAAAGPLDLIVAPSGYGLPVTAAGAATEADIRLASLAADDEGGGIAGFRTFLRALAASALPIVFVPGVIHLPSVPVHRKINRVDMGTADKVCACALAIHQEARRVSCLEEDVSLILAELGGAFSAVIAIEHGRIVDGAGGTSGPIGMAAAGALDGEVAFLAGTVTKEMLFGGGAGVARALSGMNREAYIEGLAKSIAAISVTVPGVRDVVLSGRMASDTALQGDLTRRLATAMGKITVHLLVGFTGGAKQGAQGAALIADGLAGGASSALVTTMGIRSAAGTVLDHLRVISPATARRRIGLA